MSPIDVVAIVILIVAILVLVYYYLQNNPASVQKLRTYVPTTADPHMGEILQKILTMMIYLGKKTLLKSLKRKNQ